MTNFMEFMTCMSVWLNAVMEVNKPNLTTGGQVQGLMPASDLVTGIWHLLMRMRRKKTHHSPFLPLQWYHAEPINMLEAQPRNLK